ncbi:MAG: sulfite oxidase [Lysobacterales bacterium]
MRERGIIELLRDSEDTGPVSLSRRRWLTDSVLLGCAAGAASAVSQPVVRSLGLLPAGLLPAALAQQAPNALLASHPDLRILNDRPINAETPAHLLDDDITPAARMFVRNNGIPPVKVEADSWRLTIGGESVLRQTTFSVADLQREFSHHTYQLQIECGGNGRSEFRPPASGNQWSTGAISCARWTGVRLRDVLEHCGIAASAFYIGYHSADTHLSGDPDKAPISRGVPMDKALEDHSLIAWAMNGEEIHPLHGAPLRLVMGGWPGSVSGKWLTGIDIRNRVHDGAKMTGNAYRVPCNPVAPGTPVREQGMCIIQSMPIKSLITFPASGQNVRAGEPLVVRGHAWAGDRAVAKVHTSVDFGATWQPANLSPPPNPLAWQRFQTAVTLPSAGYFEVWAKATDSQGKSQPMLVPGWNPKGYLNNACHRIALSAA